MGDWRVVLRLAWRNLWRNHRRTLIMLAAIVVGTWAMIFMTALMRGMVDEMVKDGISVLPGHVQIHHPEFRDDPTISNVIAPPSGELLEVLDRPEIVAWSARVRVPAVISSEQDTRGVTLVGIDPEQERDLRHQQRQIQQHEAAPAVRIRRRAPLAGFETRQRQHQR